MPRDPVEEARAAFHETLRGARPHSAVMKAGADYAKAKALEVLEVLEEAAARREAW